MEGNKENPYMNPFSIGSLTEETKVWFYFVNSVLLPSKHLSTMRKNEIILLYVLLKRYKINVGKIIENSIMSYYIRKYWGLIPHLATITRLLHLRRCKWRLGR